MDTISLGYPRPMDSILGVKPHMVDMFLMSFGV